MGCTTPPPPTVSKPRELQTVVTCRPGKIWSAQRRACIRTPDVDAPRKREPEPAAIAVDAEGCGAPGAAAWSVKRPDDHATPRNRRLVITEVANVERQYRQTRRQAAERPGLMRRLAEGYVELESASFRDKLEAEIKARSLRHTDPKRAAKHKKQARKALKIIKAARKAAIKYYKRLARQYPTWCRAPGKPAGQRGCHDEVLYYLALEYDAAGNCPKARATYSELLAQWPGSAYAASAQRALAPEPQ